MERLENLRDGLVVLIIIVGIISCAKGQGCIVDCVDGCSEETVKAICKEASK